MVWGLYCGAFRWDPLICPKLLPSFSNQPVFQQKLFITGLKSSWCCADHRYAWGHPWNISRWVAYIGLFSDASTSFYCYYKMFWSRCWDASIKELSDVSQTIFTLVNIDISFRTMIQTYSSSCLQPVRLNFTEFYMAVVLHLTVNLFGCCAYKLIYDTELKFRVGSCLLVLHLNWSTASRLWHWPCMIHVAGPPPLERSTEQRSGKMLLTAALAGGIASCVSTVALFPLDTLKTRLQSTAGASIQSIAKSAPEIGVKGLYRYQLS